MMVIILLIGVVTVATCPLARCIATRRELTIVQQGGTQQYQPPQQQTSYNQSGGRGNGRNNRNNGGRNNNSSRRSNPQHPVKQYNNWFYCYSCGFNTPHEGHSCTHRKTGHMSNLTREMKIADMHLPAEQQRYCSASHAGHHKCFFPSQAAANGYPNYQRDM
jgi:hypothetical protein